MDETLTSYLAAPLPEEVLRRAANQANLFGKYVFLHEVGRGATGAVIRAWDTYLSRHVALKFLHATASRTIELDDSQRVQDFLREARLAARLHHPNIVQIHEVDCREGRYFICMDFIGGGTLADRIHGVGAKRVPTRFYHEPRRFLELLHTIALAVHHAHRQTPPVVHRDLKPQNVLLDGQDKPFVADFGLANEVQVGSGDAGGVRGTPAYMAPEQALGRTEDIDPRTDVYSLGVLLFEMLTGEAPFKGENIPSVLRKVVHEDPEVPGLVADRKLGSAPELAACPAQLRLALDGVCAKAMAKKRDDRYDSAFHFAEALVDLIPQAGPEARPAPPPPPPRKSRKWRASLAGVLLLLLLLFAFVLRPSSPAPAPALPPPGDDLATLASRYQAAGQWAILRGVLAELHEKAPGHPRLPEFDRALASYDAEAARRRRDWAALLSTLQDGADFPADLPQRLEGFPELQADFQNDLRHAVAQREASLMEETHALVSGVPQSSWVSDEVKARATSLRRRLFNLKGAAAALHDSVDPQPVTAAIARADEVIAYRGTWSLRINVTPYAEFRLLENRNESAHDFTPSHLDRLDVHADRVVLELAWPSFADSKRRWSGPLPPLSAGDTLVVSGDLETPELRVERR
jgi:serine/threonine protein kinase